MPPLTEYLPHRQVLPRRRCAECEVLLSSMNDTDTCWACDPRWSEPTAFRDDRPLPKYVTDALMDAIGEMLA
jgi:hypothetical protein